MYIVTVLVACAPGTPAPDEKICHLQSGIILSISSMILRFSSMALKYSKPLVSFLPFPCSVPCFTVVLEVEHIKCSCKFLVNFECEIDSVEQTEYDCPILTFSFLFKMD